MTHAQLERGLRELVLLRGDHENIDDAESNQRECHDYRKENQTANSTVLKAFSPRNFDTVKQPVR